MLLQHEMLEIKIIVFKDIILLCVLYLQPYRNDGFSGSELCSKRNSNKIIIILI